MSENTIHGAFQAVAALTPRAVAIRSEQGTMDFGELDRRSSQWANYLRRQGVGRGTRVGTFLSGTPESLIILLGILKAGGTYLPLDPADPAGQLEFMLTDSAPAITLYGVSHPCPELAHLLAFVDVEIIRSAIDDESGSPPMGAISADEPAYILYTSGSTGRPKGILTPHRAVLRLVQDPSFVRLGPGETILQLAPLTFDASTLEIWGNLLNGGSVAVIPAGQRSLDEIGDAIQRHGASTMWLTAGLFHLIVDTRIDMLRPLRQLLAGGDTLSPPHVRRFLDTFPDCRLINGYGPTENTTFTCCYDIPADIGVGQPIPIGFPIGGTTVHILDADLKPVPPGESGELCTGGAGLALGYVNNPELTAAKFVNDPFGDVPGALLYRTGDLARVGPDGAIEFLGRLDRQVKINGKRLELDGVEAALRQCAFITDAAVVIRDETATTKRIVAYVTTGEPVSATDTHAVQAKLRAELRAGLPEHMIPATFIFLDQLPLTPNGKIDRRALPDPNNLTAAAQPAKTSVTRDARTVEQALVAIWRRLLAVETIDPDDNFFDLGGTSLDVIAAHVAVQDEIDPKIPVVALFAHPSIRALTAYLTNERQGQPAQEGLGNPSGGPETIAIVGMAGRFPGAPSVGAFWTNISQGVDSVTHFDPDSLEDAFTDEERAAPNYVPARPILENVDLFDAEFFGISPREAELADPQHRLFLECAWEAIEDAGYDHARYPGSIAVFAGCSMPTYFLNNVCADRSTIETFTSGYQVDEYPTLMGAGGDFLATRVSYKLDLRGPSMTVQTACSTSLVAVVQACQALRIGQADMAIAGAVSITFPQRRGYFYEEGGMVSADGVCRPFEERANGTIFGSGAGAVLLKRLSDAIADGDHIYATITGTALNNDGASKVGYTAPSVERQADVVRAAHRAAGVSSRSIGYVECHGTATPLGDPIEFAGLVDAFDGANSDRGFCAIGSVKGNVGHLDVAAGVTGLIKTALALKTGLLPPTAHFERPNPLIDFENSPFFVNSTQIPWPHSDGPRRAGVSALGVGGTNAHVVMEQPPEQSIVPASQTDQLLVLSARTPAALARMQSGLASFLRTHPDLSFPDVAYTLQLGRRPFDYRFALACSSLDDAATGLLDASNATTPKPASPKAASRVAFMFPGQGSQYPGMGAALYRTQPVFKDCIDRCADILLPLIGRDLRELIHPADATDADAAVEALKPTMHAQPAIFAIEYALAQLWISVGIRPVAMVGHSVGELAAACIAGVFSLEDALTLVAIRGRLMQDLPGGAMLAVRLAETELNSRIGPDVAVAAINAPGSCVLAGPYDAIAAIERRLEADDLSFRRLQTSHAFHSPMMDPVLGPLAEEIGKLQRSAPQIPFISGVTGDWITPEQAMSPEYWADHCRAPVRFSDSLARLVGDLSPVLLEVGPGTALNSFSRQGAAAAGPSRMVVSSLPVPDAAGSNKDSFLTALGQLWQHGVAPDWIALHPAGGRRVSLPTYSFDRKRHWIEAPQPQSRTNPTVQFAKSEKTGMEMQPMSAVETKPLQNDHSRTAIEPNGERVREIQTAIVSICEEVSGISVDDGALETTFLELGFDSLLLGQVAQKLKKRFNVKITFRQLLGAQPTVAALTRHLLEILPAAPVAAPVSAAPLPIPADTPAPVAVPMAGPMLASPPPQELGTSATVLERVLHDQLAAMSDLMRQQLSVLQGHPPVATPMAAAVELARTEAPTTSPARPMAAQQGNVADKSAAPAKAAEMTAAQKQHVAALIERYTARTPGSKRLTQEYRSVLADPRAASGFRQEWKEMVYPIVCDRSSGSRLWDVDGNEYIDLVNGYGQTAFGHTPDFVVDAVTAQLHRNFAIGPQSEMAGKVAALFSELTGNERVTFCNTGSEAVMAALRVARTVTGRSRVVMFGGAYHGQFDEVLVKGARRGGINRTLSTAPGVPDESVANITVLDYATPASLAWIRENADDLAAVIVEPVQSRHPGLQPKAFLSELRDVTEASGTALIFDEVVTGFRVHPGGMQAVFGIRADMATYGKVVGGGMPIGVLAGRAAYMDALDGGAWRFGDDSFPEVAPTFFAGTFVRHPLVLAALWAVLNHIKTEGPKLQEGLTQMTGSLVASLNDILQRRGLQTRAETFGSMFYFDLTAEDRDASLIYYHMRARGIHIQEGFPCFLTTSHDQSDIAQIAAAFDESLGALQAAGILAGTQEVDLSDAAPATAESASPPSDPGEVTLTEPQTEIWLSSQLSDAASCAFNESVSIRLKGSLDLAALEGAVSEVVARHDALRAIFSPSGETMRFATPHPLKLDRLDLSGLDAEAALKALLNTDAATPFDLVAGPPFRFQLVRIATNQHVLVFTAHHIVCDGWSINVIVGEIAALYDAARNHVPALLDPPMAFSDYAADCASKTGQSDEAYWLGKFKTPVQPLDLPTDRPRPDVKSFNGGTCTGRIDADITNAVRRAGAAKGCTLFSTLLTAFQVLMGRLSAQSETVVGIPTAGQSLVDDQILVGHCVNFLPVRAGWQADTTWAALMSDTRQAVMELYDHQDYTFGTLVRKLGLPRTPNRLPLVDVQFNLEKLAPGMAMQGLEVEIAGNPKRYVNFDLFFNITEGGDGLRIDCDYSTDLFDERTIARWIDCYRTLLSAIAAAPDMLVEEAPLLSVDERAGLCGGGNATEIAYPRQLGVHRLFENQAARTPDAVAACHGEAALTYAELDRAANRLAHHIQARVGDRPGTLVAVHMERSLDMVVALMAVLKAGCAYLPLDPKFPAARLQLILGDAHVAAILTDSDRTRGLVADEIPLIRIDLEKQAIDQLPAQAPATTRLPEDLAYVIYTSGSTGMPKGVEVSHGALTNFLTAMSNTPGLHERDVLLAVTTISFDIAALELFLPLVTGARLVIGDPREVTDGYALLDRLKACGATVMQATPTLWAILLEAGFNSWPGLKMLCGGEPLNRTLADRLLAGGGELWNMYGPTETTIWSAVAPVQPDGAPITIGKPIANTRLYVLDSRRQPVPAGIPGELWIAGDGVARGYHGRPDLTAERFRPDPFYPGSGSRMYATGDMARRTADDEVILLGRLDHQVKLRGYRIELGDIEASLSRCPGVSGCAIALREEVPGSPQLVAYYTATEGDGPTPNVLRVQLAQELPDYMVPTAWLRLNALPRTPNGKLDRAQLPSLSSPLSAAASIARTLRVPETALEGQLADIWKAVLNSEDIGIDDDLYALGADSIHLFQITARALREGIPLSAQLLVQYRTIAKIASALDAGTGTLSSDQRSSMPRLKKFTRMNGAATAGHGASTV
jgi:amino acid adenylation domain-containing protein